MPTTAEILAGYAAREQSAPLADEVRHHARRVLHPSPQGMHRVAEAIEPTLARMMGDAIHMG